MKKIIALIMLLVSLATANAKTDWSKVKLTYQNACNVYKFEIAGTTDTCFSYRYVEIADFNAKVISRTYTRTFTVTFPDTGTYYWASSIKNKCNGDDTTMFGTIRVTCKPTTTKCNWSTLKLQQWNERNYYKWYVSGAGIGDDTCVSYQMAIYNFQTGKSQILKGGKDTGVGFEYYLYEKNGLVEVLFNTRGRYKLYLKVINKCTNCDTALYRMVELIQFPGAGFGWTVDQTNCKKYKFEMNYIKNTSLKDTCMEYYMVFYKGPWMDTMTQQEWDNLTDYQIGMEYDFPDADYLGYTQTRIAEFTFADTGRVLMYAQWWNKCLKQDTFMFRRLDVCKTATSKVKVPVPTTSGIKVSPNPANDKVIFSVASTNKVASNTYEVYDSKGKLVMSGKMGGSICVGVSHLPNGVYVVKIGKLSQKFVVQH